MKFTLLLALMIRSLLFPLALPEERKRCITALPLNLSCIIDYADGMEGISLATTSFKEIEKVLGPGIRSKKKYPRFTVENIFPATEYILSYPELGLSFTTHPQGRMNFNRVATSLIINSNSPCKSEDGIGIGSSYQDLKDKFQDLKYKFNEGYGYSYTTSTRGEYSEAAFSLSDSNGVFLSFKCKGKKHIDDFKVEEILIRRSVP